MRTMLGLAAILLGGAMQGVFALPLKYTPRWRWENTWLVYSSSGMLLLPWLAAALFSHGLVAIYSQSGGRALSAAVLSGLGWGLGCVLCGRGIVALGIALASSIILGLASGLGALLPLVVLHSERLTTLSGLFTVAGVAVMLAGITVCAAAGRAREAANPEKGKAGGPRALLSGVLICVASGILSACINFGFAFGGRISERAEQLGNSPGRAVYPLLALILSSGFVANAGYCMVQLRSNRSWPHFRRAGTIAYWPLGFLMGTLVFGGVLLYGLGAAFLGALGTSAGWALCMSAMIIAANTAGFLTGEWTGASRQAARLMMTGAAILVTAIVLLGFANA